MTPDIQRLIEQAAQRYNLPVDVFTRQIGAESNFNPNAVSRAGAIGLGQLMPGTAKGLGVDPHDAAQNVQGAAMYMRQLLNQFDGDWDKALAAYNWGPGNVTRLGTSNLPNETRNYLATIRGDGSGPFSRGPVDLPSGQPQQAPASPPSITMPNTPAPQQAPDPGMLSSMLTAPLISQFRQMAKGALDPNQITPG